MGEIRDPWACMNYSPAYLGSRWVLGDVVLANNTRVPKPLARLRCEWQGDACAGVTEARVLTGSDGQGLPTQAHVVCPDCYEEWLQDRSERTKEKSAASSTKATATSNNARRRRADEPPPVVKSKLSGRYSQIVEKINEVLAEHEDRG